ncbi:hypothetical protein SAMN02910317_01328 [Ruminococcaceae bacterium FB2012]|nr:hypothetical protein SAMN02910317_01328 [Ruminococcaceae bacterium FB2012]
MTYKIDQFVRKISSPITVLVGDKILEFENGETLAGYVFDRKYSVAVLRAEGSAVVITLDENEQVNDTNWIGEEQQTFF